MRHPTPLLVLGAVVVAITAAAPGRPFSAIGPRDKTEAMVTHAGITARAIDIAAPNWSDGIRAVVIHGAVWEDHLVHREPYALVRQPTAAPLASVSLALPDDADQTPLEAITVDGKAIRLDDYSVVASQGARTTVLPMLNHFFHAHASSKSFAVESLTLGGCPTIAKSIASLATAPPVDALAYATQLWASAKSAYANGDRAVAYHFLGRVLHLLEDQGSPAHALLVPHVEDSLRRCRPDGSKDDSLRADGFEVHAAATRYARDVFGDKWPTVARQPASLGSAFKGLNTHTVTFAATHLPCAYGDPAFGVDARLAPPTIDDTPVACGTNGDQSRRQSTRSEIRRRQESILHTEPPRRFFERHWPADASLALMKETVRDVTEVAAGVILLFEEEVSRSSRPGIVVVIDRSGSMSGPRLANARAAARSFLERIPEGTPVALVAFDHSASILRAMRPLTAADRPSAVAAIESLSARGGTSFNAALTTAAEVAAGPAAIVLLTDGDSRDQDLGVERVTVQGSRVYGIAFGDWSGAATVRDIAHRTGGRSYVASEASIRRIYATIFARVTGATELLSHRAHFAQVGDTEEIPFRVPAGLPTTSAVTVTVQWGGSDLSLALIAPSGERIDATHPGHGAVFSGDPGGHVRSVMLPRSIVGEWRAVVTALMLGPHGTDYSVSATVTDPAPAWALATEPQVRKAAPVPLGIELADPGVKVVAAGGTVVSPSGARSELPLADDGREGDEVAGDGIFSRAFRETGEVGVYFAELRVRGASGKDAYERNVRTTFQVGTESEVSEWLRGAGARRSYGVMGGAAASGGRLPAQTTHQTQVTVGASLFVAGATAIVVAGVRRRRGRGGATAVVVGRDPACTCVVDEESVSAKHLSLEPCPDGTWIARDLGSTNGTRVNGHPIAGATQVRLDDRVGFGNQEHTVRVLITLASKRT